MATPPEFPKGIPGIWSPEHLFTAAVSSCLMTTFLFVAENSKLDFVSFRCQSKGKLDQVDGKFLMTEVLLRPVVVKEEKDRERALKLRKGNKSKSLMQLVDNDLYSLYRVACLFAQSTNQKRAMEYLELAFKKKVGIFTERLPNDPFLDPLRNLPEFQELLRKVDYPKMD